jgi:uncharacterized protein (DUF2141 family)
MKRLALLCALAACGGPPPTTPMPTVTLPPGSSTLAVDIEGVRSSNGNVSCSLFNAADGFPGPSPIVNGARTSPASQPTMHCEWSGIPAGDYAVAVQHDEDGDGTLDTNFVGAPTEGYGATNNVYPGTRAPSFEESKVSLGESESRSFTITLKY